MNLRCDNKMRELLQELPSIMLEKSADWSYCGFVAEWVVLYLRDNGYSDARIPVTDGHSFVLVGNDKTIVDLWEPDGSLRVKVFPVESVKHDDSYRVY